MCCEVETAALSRSLRLISRFDVLLSLGSVPRHLFSTISLCFVVPYLRQELFASALQVYSVLLIGLAISAIVEVWISWHETPILTKKETKHVVIAAILLILGLLASMGFSTIHLWSFDEKFHGENWINVGCAALLFGVAHSLLSIHSRLLWLRSSKSGVMRAIDTMIIPLVSVTVGLVFANFLFFSFEKLWIVFAASGSVSLVVGLLSLVGITTCSNSDANTEYKPKPNYEQNPDYRPNPKYLKKQKSDGEKTSNGKIKIGGFEGYDTDLGAKTDAEHDTNVEDIIAKHDGNMEDGKDSDDLFGSKSNLKTKNSKKARKCLGCPNFGDFLEPYRGSCSQYIWILWIFVLTISISMGSLVYFASDWYAQGAELIPGVGFNITSYDTTMGIYAFSGMWGFSYIGGPLLLVIVFVATRSRRIKSPFQQTKFAKSKTRTESKFWIFNGLCLALSVLGLAIIIFIKNNICIIVGFCLLGLYQSLHFDSADFFGSFLDADMGSTNTKNMMSMKPHLRVLSLIKNLGQIIGIGLLLATSLLDVWTYPYFLWTLVGLTGISIISFVVFMFLSKCGKSLPSNPNSTDHSVNPNLTDDSASPSSGNEYSARPSVIIFRKLQKMV